MTRARKRFERNRRFLAAICIAVIFKLGKMNVPELVKAVWKILRSITTRKRSRIDRWLYYRKMRCCFKCPIFFLPLRTCSSPLMPGGEEVGCNCDMEIKAANPKAECWADEFFGDKAEFGWKHAGICNNCL